MSFRASRGQALGEPGKNDPAALGADSQLGHQPDERLPVLLELPAEQCQEGAEPRPRVLSDRARDQLDRKRLACESVIIRQKGSSRTAASPRSRWTLWS